MWRDCVGGTSMKLYPLAKEFWANAIIKHPLHESKRLDLMNAWRQNVNIQQQPIWNILWRCVHSGLYSPVINNICRWTECLEKLLPWDLCSPFSAFTKKPQLFFWKVSVCAGQFSAMVCKCSSKSLGLMKESYYSRKLEHISRDLQTAGMHRVNRQSNTSDQHVLIVHRAHCTMISLTLEAALLLSLKMLHFPREQVKKKSYDSTLKHSFIVTRESG